MKKPLRSFAYAAIAVCASLTSANNACAHEPLNIQPSSVFHIEPNTCATSTLANPFPDAPPNYVRKYNTIAHRFLDAEKGAGDVTPTMYLILDTLMDEARSTLKPYTHSMSPDQERIYAGDALRTIDCILLRHRFVYPGHGLVQQLTDGLGPTMYSGAALIELKGERHNVRRSRFITEPAAYYVVDCDVASFIYLGIADLAGFPIHMVDIPEHDFVRWDIADGSYVDFETMDGAITSDEYYITDWGIPDKFTKLGGVLKSMRPDEATAYHDAVVATSWEWRRNTGKMKEFFLKSIAADSTRGFAANNLGWFYASAPERSERDGAQAVYYAKQSVAVFPDAGRYDTLACAYAQNGNFPEGIQQEINAENSGYLEGASGVDTDKRLIASGSTCNDPGVYTDPEPFRPGHAADHVATQRELMALH